MSTKKIDMPTEAEINAASLVLGKLILQGKYAHMKTPVQAIMGGLLLPSLVDLGAADATDPKVSEMLGKYSKTEVKKQLAPEPVVVKQFVGDAKDRPIYRRRAHTVNKEKRIERELDPGARDVMNRWWNTNQRLVPKGDPICAILTDQINALNPSTEPLSSMQIAGYFSRLCDLGRMTQEHRDNLISKHLKKGRYTIVPKFSDGLTRAIQENWEFEQKNAEARKKDHAKIDKLIEKGEYRPVLDDPKKVLGYTPVVAKF